MARILVDTSALYALMDRSDSNHRQAQQALSFIKGENAQVFITNFIKAETHALLLSRLGADLARRWLLGNRWPVERATERDEDLADEIIARHRDKAYSYVDCVSFALMERLHVRHAFAFDVHFRQYGFTVLP